VLVGSFMHETNTFVPDLTERADFEAGRVHDGDALVEALSGTATPLGGIVDALDDADGTPVPTLAARAEPGGPVSADAYDRYADRIVAAARENADDVDGVALALHGAMVPEDGDDGEGSLLARVRAAVGDRPVVAALDLHANVSAAMIDAADALVAYETYPHVDQHETGERAVGILLAALREGIEPAMHVERPPTIVFQPRAYTPSGPMAEVMARAREHERRDGVLKANVLPGYYHADVPEMSATTPVVTDGDPALAREVARDLATAIWERREAFVGAYPTASEAVPRVADALADRDTPAHEVGEGPIVMGDFGGNPGGGGAADGTSILREWIDRGLANVGYAVLYDPDVVEAAVGAGVGERVVVDLGGKFDARSDPPIRDLDCYVKAIADGRYVNTGTSHSGYGVRNDIGPTVRLACGPDDGVCVIVSATRHSAFDAEIWRHLGVQPERLSALSIPSFIAFLGDYEPMSSDVVLVDTPGPSAVDPARFEYDRIARPRFPLDDLDDDAYP